MATLNLGRIESIASAYASGKVSLLARYLARHFGRKT
jgi:hypothetical protein